MEFMPQPYELAPSPSADPVVVPSSPSSDTARVAHVVEEEVAASIKIGGEQDNQQQQQHLQQATQPPEQPIYYSDGVMYASELASSQSDDLQVQNNDQTVAIPDNLIEIYNNLGLIGKLLTGGSLVTIKFLQAFRTIGESLVDVLGITRPKYEYELNLARQMQEQEEARKQKLDQLYAPWQPPPQQPVQSTLPVNTVLSMDGGVALAPAVTTNLISPPPAMTSPSVAVQYPPQYPSTSYLPQIPQQSSVPSFVPPQVHSQSFIPSMAQPMATLPQAELPPPPPLQY